MESLDPKIAKHMELFRELFQENPFFWDQNQNFLLYMLKNFGKEYVDLPLDKVYKHAKMFRLAYLNFDTVYDLVKKENETCDHIMEAFKNYYNELVDHLILKDGGDVIIKEKLYKML
jgi:hypothetical protein